MRKIFLLLILVLSLNSCVKHKNKKPELEYSFLERYDYVLYENYDFAPVEEKYMQMSKKIKEIKMYDEKTVYRINTQIVDILSHDWKKEYGRDALCFGYNITCDDNSLYFENVNNCEEKSIYQHKLKDIVNIMPEASFNRPYYLDKKSYELNKDNHFVEDSSNRGTYISDGYVHSKTCRVKGAKGEEHTIEIEVEPIYMNPTDEMASEMLPHKEYPIGIADIRIIVDGYKLVNPRTGIYSIFYEPDLNYRQIYVEYKKETDEFCRVVGTEKNTHGGYGCVKREILPYYNTRLRW